MAADQNQPTFKVDAGRMLAKLHAAGQVALAKNCLIVNTGILDPKDTASPEDIGDMTFDVKSASKPFQIGIGTNGTTFIVSYKLPIDLKLDKEYNSKVKAVNKQKKSEKVTDGKESSSVISAKKEVYSIISKYAASFSKEAKKDVDELLAEAKKAAPESPLAIDDLINKFEAAVKKENQARAQEKESALKEGQTTALKHLKTYLTAFAGKQNASKASAKDLVPMMMSIHVEKTTDSVDVYSHVSKNQIEATDEKELEKQVQDIQEKDPNKPTTPMVFYVVGYELDASMQ